MHGPTNWRPGVRAVLLSLAAIAPLTTALPRHGRVDTRDQFRI